MSVTRAPFGGFDALAISFSSSFLLEREDHIGWQFVPYIQLYIRVYRPIYRIKDIPYL